MEISHLTIISILLLLCAATHAFWVQENAAPKVKDVAGEVKKVNPKGKSLTDSHNGKTQTPEQASQPFNCSAIPVSNRMFNLSALDQDWKVISDTDGMMLNPCGSLRYSNDFCPAGQTSLCLLEKTGGNGIASFGAVSKILLSPKGMNIDFCWLGELVLLYTSDMFTNEGLPITGVVKFVCDPSGKKVPSP